MSLKNNLCIAIDQELVEKLLNRYKSIKQDYLLGKDEKCLLKIGKFVEIATRIVEYITSGDYTPFSDNLSVSSTLKNFEQLPREDYPESIRILIPRVLYSIYTFRSKRGGAHEKDISPNHIDATYTVMASDWVMSEFIRLYHTEDAAVVQQTIDSMVERKFPLVEEFGEDLKILHPHMPVSDKVQVVLYKKYPQFISTSELKDWIKTKHSSHIPTTLRQLDDRGHIYRERENNKLTRLGLQYVEQEIIPSVDNI